MFQDKINIHPVAKFNYLPRIVGCLLTSAIVTSIFYKNISPFIVIGIIFHGIIWPHMAFFYVKKSKDSKKAEFVNLMLDSFIIGIWTSLISFSFLASAALNIAILLDNMTSGGLKLLFKGIFSTALGIIIASLFFGFEVSFDASPLTEGISAFCITFFTVLVSYISHNVKLKYKDAKTDLKKYAEELQEARDALWGEMQLAKKIQTLLLPENPAISGFSISCFMKPAKSVTGDYYDIINCDSRDWVMIGDVSGHGVSAGLVMMMVQSSLRSLIVGNENIEPSELLKYINRSIGYNLSLINENKFMTITAIVLNSNGEAVLSGRHEDILFYEVSSRAVKSIKMDGICISNMELGKHDKNISFLMKPGDTVLLYTDGITEARNNEEEMFTESGLINVLKESGHKTVDEIREDIFSAIEDYNVDDDATLIVIKKE